MFGNSYYGGENQMGQVTHEQANLLLRIYELRREPRLREARAWFIAKFDAPKTPEDRAKTYPPGSVEDANIRMVISYWDMVAGLVNRGLIDDELFFESSGEAWIVWDRIRDIAATARTMFKNPHMYRNLEQVIQRMEEWQERRAPGHIAVVRQMMAAGRQAAAKSTGD